MSQRHSQPWNHRYPGLSNGLFILFCFALRGALGQVPVQQREHPQILRAACGLLGPDHISEVRDDDLATASWGQQWSAEEVWQHAYQPSTTDRSGRNDLSREAGGPGAEGTTRRRISSASY
jgi:hypothetical protein